jgi:(hydroxyamino)benzene mutase
LAQPSRAESPQPTVTADRALVAHGAVMMLLGLLSGFSPFFAKAKIAGLEAHNIGVVQSALLFGLAAIWPSLGKGAVVTAARYCALFGLYANWLGAQLSALWSAKGMFIVNGASMPGGATPWMENTVAVLLNVSILVIVMCLLILWALRRNRMDYGSPRGANGRANG